MKAVKIDGECVSLNCFYGFVINNLKRLKLIKMYFLVLLNIL